MKKSNEPKLFEYRIKYNSGAGHAAQDSYHYYNAQNAKEAFYFHDSMVKKHNLRMQTLSIEKYNPYSNSWEDKSVILEEQV